MNEAYTGKENLEVMKQAKNYNAYLENLVRTYSHGTSVLDFSAGAGTFARTFTSEHTEVLCLEPDAGLRDELENSGLKTCDSLEKAPSDAIDYIYSLNVLEHIESDGQVIKLLFSKLQPGGRLMLYVPAFQTLFSAMDRQVGHFRRYRRPGLGRLLRAAGFEVDEARYVDSLGFVATLLYKWFGDSSGIVNTRGLVIYDTYIFPVSLLVDRLIGGLFGKNLIITAHKPAAPGR